MKKIIYLAFLLLGTTLSAQLTHVPINEVDAKKMKKSTLLDVRSPEEFSESHLEGAVNMDVNNDAFIKNIESLNKSKTVMVYCRTGKRSRRAATILDSLGFEKVINLEGGITAWMKSGLPVIEGEKQ
ncbi:rhodanese-like domain-containing protein [Robertkochia solimangrovi]|uniref:rhodanese-like domain-containing protein n=1 Tax=Robertkochia solimangrovi TaxID=2213046 RepID=UPI00118123E4|nr:rhodanese-like domain-containing protein [Robertkochia solimangrovi]TRZ44259.1 rhodanese-like domain-containing protein [Robertkochia solimangrovi]